MQRLRQYFTAFGKLKSSATLSFSSHGHARSGRFLCAVQSQAKTKQVRRYVHSSDNTYQQPTRREIGEHDQLSARLHGEYLVVTLEDGSTEEYPVMWLRDNCQCSKCFNQALHSRTIDWKTFDMDVKPVAIEVADGESVAISWADGHRSSYHVAWLKNRSFDAEARRRWLDETYRPPKIAWGSQDFPTVMQRFKFDDMINSDDHLLAWLETMAKYGLAIVEDTPNQRDQVRRFAERVGFIKGTHYGKQFEIMAKVDTTNLAFLAVPLQLHTDLPYYEYTPGFNLLHCLVQTEGEGGDNQITDMVKVTDILRRHHPDEFRVLTETLVDWNDIADDVEGPFYSLYRAPVISLDRNGMFERVNYAHQQRDSHFKVALEDVIPWYRANKTLIELI